MPTLMEPNVQREPELNLLLPKETLDQSLLRSLFSNLDDYFFPKKLPPLVLTSRPVPVRDIWGFSDYKKNGAAGAVLVHIVARVLLGGGTILGRSVVKQIVKPDEHVTWVPTDEIPVLQPSK